MTAGEGGEAGGEAGGLAHRHAGAQLKSDMQVLLRLKLFSPYSLRG